MSEIIVKIPKEVDKRLLAKLKRNIDAIVRLSM